ncbi:LamB/YcsF family protein [Suttonella sp. R2A3]|uniref:5-oxoprolinase subunit PxpA n=1 Tax=Suttonella sp. R2A3 TaxID=2908648 RepID=UPI001F3AAA37|nr:5-oxoprolinase subunit PxpA [Suttonella sp. R2A3]UJF24975.1 LamB/YcsF family protein [Suttonella sp. R2A3]
MTHWLLNADVGEGCDDSLVMPYIDCANIACGAHAGDQTVMQQTLELAKTHQVMPGAHPGYPDREHFGRHSLDLPIAELERTLTEQITTLSEMALNITHPLHYVKPHGALNHDMLQHDEIFDTICRVTYALSPDLAIMVPTNARQDAQQAIAKRRGLTIWWEVFADRAYEPSGLLRPRKYDDALHATPARILSQLDEITSRGQITAIDGTQLDIAHASTICIHGDHEPSVQAIAQWHN